MRASSVSITKPLLVELSDNLLLSHDAEVTEPTNGATFTKKIEFNIALPGRYRITYEAKATSVRAVHGARVYVNGAGRGTANMSLPTSYTAYQDDINVQPGDLVQLYLQCSYAGETTYARLFRIKGDVGNEIGVELPVP